MITLLRYPTHKTISVIPFFDNHSIICSNTGLLPSGSIPLGTNNVYGRSLVPSPPARMTAFICVHGDVILKNNLRKMISYHKSKKAIATIGLTKYSTKMSYGFIETEKNGLVRSWSEKPEISGLINAGLYVFEPSFLTSIPKGTIFGMDSAFESVIKGNRKVFGYEIEGGFLDIGDRRTYLSVDRKYISELETIP